MSDPIKGPSGPANVEAHALEQADAAQAPQGDFQAALLEQAQASALDAAADLSQAEAVIEQVAQQLQSGALAGPEEALERVIDGIIEARFGQLPPRQLQRMSRDLRATLLEDPFFALEVEEVLLQAMERA